MSLEAAIIRPPQAIKDLPRLRVLLDRGGRVQTQPLPFGVLVFFQSPSVAKAAKRKSSAPSYHYYLFSYEIVSGDLRVRFYEVARAEMRPMTLRDYARERHEYCERNATDQERDEWLDEHGPDFDGIELWPYIDRTYRDATIQELTKTECEVLRKYL